MRNQVMGAFWRVVLRAIVLLPILALAMAPACPTPIDPTNHDAADGAELATPSSACINLANIGCLEGADPHCPTVLANVIDSGLTSVDIGCLTRAATKEAARACGPAVTCP